MLQLILRSDRQRFRHVVVSLNRSHGPIFNQLQTSGVEVHTLDMPKSRVTWHGWRKLLRLLREQQPDVLHCWMYHACLVGALAVPFVRVKRLLWGIRAAHANLSDYGFLTQMVIRLCAACSRRPESIIYNSHTSLEAHRQLGYSMERARIIPNGVDEIRFSPDPMARQEVRRELAVSDDAPLIGLCARYDPMKDHETFLRSAALTRQHFPASRFVLFGPGVDAGNVVLQQIIRELELSESVLLLGERQDTPRLYAALDVACLSSWTESFPNVVVEAMACGIPSVVTDAGDSAAIVGDTGLVVPVRNPQALSDGLSSLLARTSQDRAALGQRARERVLGRFTLARAVAQYESLYLGEQGKPVPHSEPACIAAP